MPQSCPQDQFAHPDEGFHLGPQTFRPEDAPDYTSAKITILVCWGLCILDLYFIWWWFRRENAKKARVRAEPGYVKLRNQEYVLRIASMCFLQNLLEKLTLRCTGGWTSRIEKTPSSYMNYEPGLLRRLIGVDSCVLALWLGNLGTEKSG